MTIEELAQNILDRYASNLQQAGKVASGELARSTYSVSYNGQEYEVYFNLPSYWEVIEYGASYNGKMPPVEAIEKWISIKALTPRPDKYGRVPSTRQLAFAICKSILKRPAPQFPAYNLLEKAMDDSRSDMEKYLEEVIEKKIEKLKE